MNGPAKKYFLAVVSLSLACLVVIPVVNLLTDRHRVLSGDYAHTYGKKIDVNRSFLTVRYVMENRDRFDSIIFGSSRARRGFNLDHLGTNWFVFDTSFASMEEDLYNLRALLAEGIRPHTIWLTIDDFAIYHTGIDQNDYVRRMYPLSYREWVSFYWFYLFEVPEVRTWKILIGASRLKDMPTVDIERQGTLFPHRTAEKHSKKLLRKGPYQWYLSYQPDRIDEVTGQVGEFVELARDNGITVEVMLPPLHYKSLLARDPEHLVRFREKLAAVTEFYDFWGLNPYTLDNSNWREPGHFFSNVGDAIIGIVTGTAEAEGSFGRRVTRDNVRSINRDLITTIVDGIPDLLAKDPSIILHDGYLKNAVRLNPEVIGKGRVRAVSGRMVDDGRQGGPFLLTFDYVSQSPATMYLRCHAAGNPDHTGATARKVIKLRIGRSTETRMRSLMEGQMRATIPLDSACLGGAMSWAFGQPTRPKVMEYFIKQVISSGDLRL